LPQFDTRPDGNFADGFLTGHPGLVTAWTDDDCDKARDEKIKEITTSTGMPPPQDALDRMNRQAGYCRDGNDSAGSPFTYNENGAYGMALIELDRAIESQYDRQSGAETENARFARGIFPLMISRIERFFHHGLTLEDGHYRWKYSESSKRCCEDYSHGSVTMRFVELLRQNQSRLAPLTSEPIQLDANDLRAFANTFLHMTDNGNVAKENDWGGDDDEFDFDESAASEDYNQTCYSWVSLAPVDRRIYDRCHEMTLRSKDGWQPALTASSHAALLAYGTTPLRTVRPSTPSRPRHQ
jgi:hypothetical protein